MLNLIEQTMSNPLSEFETVRTTITIPVELISRLQQFIGRDAIPSRNALIVAALEHFLNELEHQHIDRQFEAMADDVAYQTLNERLDEEFAKSGWNALQEGETL